MSFYLSKEMRNKGVNVILEDLVTKFDTNKVCLKSGLEIDADVVILAIGVAPDTAFLKDSGIDMTDRGYIKVDEKYKTNCADVYAAGDSILVHWPLSNEIAPLALAGPANKQGRLIADAIMGRKIMNTGYIGTSCIKVFDYNAANVGLNEKSLKRLGMNYNVCYTAAYDMVSIMPHANPMFFKLIYNNDGKILGAQAVGKGSVDKRIDVIATVIKGSLSIYDLCDLELSYAPPFGTGKDIINKTGYVATNLNDGLYKQVLFTQVYDLIKEGAQIIDVREILELQAGAGTIKGAKNIPMSTLRESLDHIDKSKPVYVHCKTGQRSYNAALMLQTYGFDAFNIAGSFDYVANYEEGMHSLNSSRENILV
jgi:rhodanese-related sulfurtransferase